MIRTTNITILRYAGLPLRWWPRVRRYGSPWRQVVEIDWLHLTVVVRH